MIRLAGVRKSLSGRAVLRGVDLEVPRGGVTFVVGQSGAGKSVLARCCVGLLKVDAGEVLVGGEPITALPERRLHALRRRVPYVVQGSALLDWLDLQENVAVPLRRSLSLSAQDAQRRASAALAAVGLLELAGRSPAEVGPGARKRASIARALALEPVAVLYDEPTTGLDAAAARQVDGAIRAAADRGTTALVVSHDLASLELIADRVALLDEGKIAFEGTPAELLAAREGHFAVRRFFHGGAEESEVEAGASPQTSW